MSHLFRSSVMLLLLTSYKNFKPVFTIKNNNICPIQSSQYHVSCSVWDACQHRLWRQYVDLVRQEYHDSLRNLDADMSDFVVSFVPADGLVVLGY